MATSKPLKPWTACRVVLCETYYPDVIGDATLGEALSPAEVAAYSNNTDYKGEGILIGIVDTGLDINHEAFANDPTVQKLQKAALEKLLYTTEEVDGKTNVTAYSYAALWYAQNNSTPSQLNLLTADMLYKSGKVPFAFDYADKDADVIPSAGAGRHRHQPGQDQPDPASEWPRHTDGYRDPRRCHRPALDLDLLQRGCGGSPQRYRGG